MIRRQFVFAAIFLLVPALGIAVAQAQPQSRGAYTDDRKLPDTPAAKRVKEIIDVINAGDAVRTKAFVETSLAPAMLNAHPMEEHLAVFAQVHDRSSDLEFYSVRKYDKPQPDNEIVVIMRNKLTNGWDAIIMTVEKEPPHRIEAIQFAQARPPGDLPPAKAMSDDEMVKELETFVGRVAEKEVFSGTVLLAKDGKVLFEKAVGLASRGWKIPNKIDTKFNLGSMNKMFTAVAIAQLAEKGKLSFTDPISRYLDKGWLDKEQADKITIAHLLTHTSGLGSYFNEKFVQSSRDLYRNVNDYKPLVEGERLAFEPGSQWAYSNTGFLLLGAIVEKASGQDYFTYIRENIYKPAGMINSDCYELDTPVENLAEGYSKEYSKNGPRWTNNIFKHVIRGGPAGGGYSTVHDLLKFDRALRGGKLVKKESLDQLWTPKSASPAYGYGFQLGGTPGDRIVGHSGGFTGINAKLDMYLDTRYTVAVMSNVDAGAELVASRIQSMMPKKKS